MAPLEWIFDFTWEPERLQRAQRRSHGAFLRRWVKWRQYRARKALPAGSEETASGLVPEAGMTGNRDRERPESPR
jgi:hypothetical protein